MIGAAVFSWTAMGLAGDVVHSPESGGLTEATLISVAGSVQLLSSLQIVLLPFAARLDMVSVICEKTLHQQ